MAGRDADRTRARILKAAEKEFAAHGLAGARVARIAQAARVNQRMLYHYFGSKQGLYEALLLHLDETFTRQLDPALDRLEEDPLSALADAVRHYFDLVSGHPTISRLTLSEVLAHPNRPLSYEFTERDPGMRMLGRVLPLIEQGRKRGQLTDRVNVPLALSFAATICLIYPIISGRLAVFYDMVGISRNARAGFTREQIVNQLLYGVAGPKAKVRRSSP